MIKLYDADTDAEIGSITESQLDVLIEQLVEETIDDTSYNVDPAIIASLETGGADPVLVAMLRRALGDRTSMEVRYEHD